MRTCFVIQTVTSSTLACSAWNKPSKSNSGLRNEDNHRLESGMREIRPSGSEGGAAQTNAPFLPLSVSCWHSPPCGQPLAGCLTALGCHRFGPWRLADGMGAMSAQDSSPRNLCPFEVVLPHADKSAPPHSGDKSPHSTALRASPHYAPVGCLMPNLVSKHTTKGSCTSVEGPGWSRSAVA